MIVIGQRPAASRRFRTDAPAPPRPARRRLRRRPHRTPSPDILPQILDPSGPSPPATPSTTPPAPSAAPPPPHLRPPRRRVVLSGGSNGATDGLARRARDCGPSAFAQRNQQAEARASVIR